MKDALIKIISNDTSYNKSATRYLYKNYPELWQQIINVTSFLPDNSKPKQRIWHVLNDVFERPVCPITGEFVKWWENRYLETANPSARTTHLNLTDRLKNQTTSAKANRTRSLREGFASGKIKPKKWTKEESANRYEKIRQATFEKYGVNSTLSLPEVIEKQYQTKVKKKTITAREDRSARQLYYDEVVRLTKLSWIEHFDKINPRRLERGNDWHLDHVYSIQAGFRENISPEIIAHWSNLTMLAGPANSKKGIKCGKTKKQLLEDYWLIFT